MGKVNIWAWDWATNDPEDSEEICTIKVWEIRPLIELAKAVKQSGVQRFCTQDKCEHWSCIQSRLLEGMVFEF